MEREEVDILIKECCDPEDDDGFIPYERKLLRFVYIFRSSYNKGHVESFNNSNNSFTQYYAISFYTFFFHNILLQSVIFYNNNKKIFIKSSIFQHF